MDLHFFARMVVLIQESFWSVIIAQNQLFIPLECFCFALGKVESTARGI